MCKSFVVEFEVWTSCSRQLLVHDNSWPCQTPCGGCSGIFENAQQHESCGRLRRLKSSYSLLEVQGVGNLWLIRDSYVLYEDFMQQAPAPWQQRTQ
jgi:hypothetical protein